MKTKTKKTTALTIITAAFRDASSLDGDYAHGEALRALLAVAACRSSGSPEYAEVLYQKLWTLLRKPVPQKYRVGPPDESEPSKPTLRLV